MTRTALVINHIKAGGLADPTDASSTTGGQKIQNDGHVFIRIVNTSGALKTITAKAPRDGALDVAVDVDNGETKFMGPFSPNIFNRKDGSTDHDLAYLDISAQAANLKFSAFHIG